MNRLKKSIVLLFVLACFVIGSHLFIPDTEKAEPIRVSAILASDDNVFWGDVWSGLREKAASLAIDLTEYPYADPSLIPSLLEINYYTDADAIVTCLPKEEFWKSSEAVLKTLSQKGTKIIVVDTLPYGKEYDVYIGMPNYQAGKDIAANISECYAKGDRIALLVYEDGPSAPQQRVDGCLETLAELGLSDEIDLLTVSQDTFQQSLLLKTYIQNMTAPTIIAGFEPDPVIEAAEIIEQFGKDKDIQLIGFGESNEAIDYVRKGTISALLSQDNKGIGLKALEAADALLNSKEPVDPEWTVDTFLITAENCNDF